MPKSKGAAAVSLGDPADDKHHKYRCRDLKRQLEELEEYNEMLAIKLLRSQKRLRRMKIERNVLLERFEQTRHYRNSHANDDDYTGSDSDAPLKYTFPHQTASDMDTNDANHRSGNAAATPTTATGRGRRRGAGAVGQTRSTAGTPQPQSANSTGTHDSTGGAALATTRRPRTEKDPLAPKRPANAFVMYCQDERPNIRKNGTDLTYSEMTKAMGQKWKNLPQEEKKKYYDLYERGMFRYQQELETYRGGGAGGSTYDNNDVGAGGTSAAGSPSLAEPSVDGGAQIAAEPYSARSEPSMAVGSGSGAAGDFGDNGSSVSQNGDMDVDREESIDGDANMAGNGMMHGSKDEPISTTETVVMTNEADNMHSTKQHMLPRSDKANGQFEGWYNKHGDLPGSDGLSPTANGTEADHKHGDIAAPVEAGVNGMAGSPHKHVAPAAAPSAVGQQPSS